MKSDHVVLLISALATMIFAVLDLPFLAITITYLSLMIIASLLKVSNKILLAMPLMSLISYNTTAYLLPFHILIGWYLIYTLIMIKITGRKSSGILLYPLSILTLYMFLTLFWTKYINESVVVTIFSHTIIGYLVYYIIRSDKSSNWKPMTVVSGLTVLGASISIKWFIVNFIKYKTNMTHYTAAYDLFANKNIVAGLLTFLLLIGLYKYKTSSANKKIFYWIPLDFMIALAILLSNSRSAIFGLFVGFLTYIFVYLMKSKKVIMSILIGGVFVSLFIYFGLSYFPSLKNQVDIFLSTRLSLYNQGFSVFKAKPLNAIFGTGIGSANYYIVNYYYHNYLLNILYTLGLVGLMIHLLIHYRIFNILNENNQFSKSMFIAVVGFLAYAYADVGFEYQFVGVVYYGLIAVVELNNEQEKAILIQTE